MAIPPFNADGLLPPGDYPLTFEGLRKSHLVRRSLTSGDGWDDAWRLRLVDNLEILTRQLWAVGIVNVFIDGSFVEDKDHPNDIDGYFECDVMHLATGDLARQLNALDLTKCGHGIQNRGSHQQYRLKTNFPCGIATKSNCIRTTDKAVASKINSVTNSNFHLRFDYRGAAIIKWESSRY